MCFSMVKIKRTVNIIGFQYIILNRDQYENY